jgi:hypothetical protein
MHQNSNPPLLVGVREIAPSRRPARPAALIRERGDAAGSAAHNAPETAVRNDPLALLQCRIDQQLGEQADSFPALRVA